MLKKYILSVMVAVIVCFSILLYWSTLKNDFVNFDDPDLVIRNIYIKTLSFQNIRAIFTPGRVGAYQPVRTLSYAIDDYFWGLNPAGYHLTNVLLHAVNTLLIYLIAGKLTREFLTASLASLLFAAHPVHVEAVAWVAGRRDVLSSAFALLAFYGFLYIRPSQFPERKSNARFSVLLYLLTMTLFVLGLLTKPSVVILPLLFLLYDMCFLPSRRYQLRRVFLYIPFFLVVLIFIRVFLTVSRASGVVESSYHGGGVYTTLLTMLQVFGEYILMLFVPTHLSATYGVTILYSFWELSFLRSLCVLVLVGVLTVLNWKRSKAVFFGIGWFFIALIPVSNIIPIAITKADRYLYLPSVGYCLVMAWCIDRCWRALNPLQGSMFRKKIALCGYWLMIGLMFASYTFLTSQRNLDWKNSHSLWTATLKTNPDSSIALNNLGLIYAQQGKYDKAMALYEQLLEFHPNQEHVERVYGNMADAYSGKQMFDEALDYYRKALEIDPQYIHAYTGLGRVHLKLGQYDEAIRMYQRALEIDPSLFLTHALLGDLCSRTHRTECAAAAYQNALKLQPENKELLKKFHALKKQKSEGLGWDAFENEFFFGTIP